eukprot:COSAG02_NODE_1481_length_12389_cov_15.643857_10_plen_100_part_00
MQSQNLKQQCVKDALQRSTHSVEHGEKMRVLCTVRVEVIISEMHNFAITVVLVFPHRLVDELALIRHQAANGGSFGEHHAHAWHDASTAGSTAPFSQAY